MSTVITVSTIPGSIGPFAVEDGGKYFTDAKVKKLGLYAFSMLAFAGSLVTGAAAFTGGLPLLLTAIPLAGLSAGLAWCAAKLIDYDDPVVLARLRGEVYGLPLSEIVAKHGWNKLFEYALLDTAGFEAAYCAHVDALNFAAHLLYYHEALRRSLPGRRAATGLPRPRTTAFRRPISGKKNLNRSRKASASMLFAQPIRLPI